MKQLALRLTDTYGITRHSLLLWRVTRPLFGDFREAQCGDIDARLNLRSDLDLVTAGSLVDFTYGLVLRDDRSQELWLSGCSAGYGGEGPRGTETIPRSRRILPGARRSGGSLQRLPH
jgi:hypothetical protein